MPCAGFVLAGGRSERMGCDKALLSVEGVALLERVAREVFDAAGSVTVIAPPERYPQLGWKCVPDLRPGLGPLGGIETALWRTAADWNLVVATDMPGVRAAWLRQLLAAAEACDADCLVPRTADGRVEPLCAVYHRRLRPWISTALDHGTRKVREALISLQVAHFPVDNLERVVNLNTPSDWLRFQAIHGQGGRG